MGNNIEELISQIELNKNPDEYSALTLAYIGDCVYELYVRTYLISSKNRKVNELHKMATTYVKAKAQAEFYHKIKDFLTDDEEYAFHRGRNAKSTPPKNADMSDYKIATGVEALIGYLYIIKNIERITYLMKYLFL